MGKLLSVNNREFQVKNLEIQTPEFCSVFPFSTRIVVVFLLTNGR